MYGIPTDLDLSFFNGAELTQIGRGVYSTQFHFEPSIEIGAFDAWNLFDGNGICIDHAMPFPRPPFQLHRLLGQRVTRTEITAPTHLELIFERGEWLRLSDTSEQYESFTINVETPRGLIIV